MTPFPVSSSKIQALKKLMERLHVKDSEFEESFIRSSGPGGQKVNKASTCVVLRHRLSGLMVRCQRERSRALNRFLARRLLLEKIERQRLGRQSQEERRIAKIRRQKRKRSKRAKEKMLEAKRKRGELKALRKPIRPSHSA